MTIGLKECAGADPVSGKLRLISQAFLSIREENVLPRGRTFPRLQPAECGDYRHLRQRRAQPPPPLPDRRSTRLGSTPEFHQQVGVVGIGKEFDFAHSLGHLARSSGLPQRGDPAIDKWGADGKFFYTYP